MCAQVAENKEYFVHESEDYADPARHTSPIFFTTPFECDLSLNDIAAEPARDSIDGQIDDKNFIKRFINDLSPREERIIRLRFGLDGVGEHSLQEVADQMNLSHGRIREIQNKALRRLRHRALRAFPARTVPDHAKASNPTGPLPAPAVSKQRRAPKSWRNLDQRGLSSLSNRDLAYCANPAEVAADQRRTKLYHEWIKERDRQREMAATDAARRAGQHSSAASPAATRVQPEVSPTIPPQAPRAFDWHLFAVNALPALVGVALLFVAVTGAGTALLQGKVDSVIIYPLQSTAFLLALACTPWVFLVISTVRAWWRHSYQYQPKSRQIVTKNSFIAWAAALVAGLCASLWLSTLGSPGAELYLELFGRSSGLLIRALIFIATSLFGPLSALMYFEFGLDIVWQTARGADNELP